jgi:hypothetical protein
VIKSVAKVVVPVHFGWWAMFTDPDGTRYALGQW